MQEIRIASCLTQLRNLLKLPGAILVRISGENCSAKSEKIRCAKSEKIHCDLLEKSLEKFRSKNPGVVVI